MDRFWQITPNDNPTYEGETLATTELPQPLWAMTTVQLPISPLIGFDRIQRRICDEFAHLLAEIDDDLAALGVGAAAAAQLPATRKRRWLR